MGKTHDHITPKLRAFIEQQQMFFVATAPLDGGRVNVSPKGLDCLRVLDEKHVAYLDLTGSGNETSAHLEQNGRITLMFCAFDGAPNILRLYGTGQAVLTGSDRFAELATRFRPIPGTRQFIVATIDRVQTSCGFGVPLFDFRGHRRQLIQYAEKLGESGIRDYQLEKNLASIDGLPTTLAKALATSG